MKRFAVAMAVAGAFSALGGELQAQTPPVRPPRADSAQQGAAPRPARRALDIRATAPAPEVVTIRPREVPQYSRTLLIPALITPPPASDRKPATIVIFPGVLPTGSAPQPQRPETENRLPE